MLTLSIAFFIGCERVTTDISANDSGTLVVKITDDPFPIGLVVRADIHIVKIDIRAKIGDGSDSTSFITVMEGDTVFNLLELRNGVTSDFPELELPVGNYDLVRVYVDRAELELTDSRVFNMKVPSGPQTGIKIFINPAIEIAGGLTSELLLDFDLTKSFIVQGNPETAAGIKGFHSKPVIRASNLSTAGRIVGSVSDTSATFLADAEVWVEQDTVVSYTYSDATGQYGLIGLPSGTYDLFATKGGYDTVSVSSIQVTAANQTIQDFVLTPQ